MKTTFELLIAFVKGILSIEENIYVETILLHEKENLKLVDRLNYLYQNNSLEEYLSKLSKIESNEEESDNLLVTMITTQELISYIKNEVSIEEKQIIKNHLEENIYSKENYIDFLLLYQKGKLDNYLEKQKIKANILFDELLVDTEIPKQIQYQKIINLKNDTPSKRLWIYGLSIAASLIGLLFVFTFFFNSKSNTTNYVTQEIKKQNNLPATLGTEKEDFNKGKTELTVLAEENIKDIEKKINNLSLEKNREHIKWNVESITRFINYKQCTINILWDSCKNHSVTTISEVDIDFPVNFIDCKNKNTTNTDLTKWANNLAKDSLSDYTLISYVAYYSQKNEKGEVVNWFRIEQKENKELIVTQQKIMDKKSDIFLRSNTNNFFEQITFSQQKNKN